MESPSVFDGTPSAREVLSILAGAREAGVTGAEFPRRFTRPATLQDRSNRANQVLHHLWTGGYVRRSERKESSPNYHHSPVWRWFITPDGIAYLGNGLRVAAALERERAYQKRAADRGRQAGLIREAAARTRPGMPPCERENAIRQLREAGCAYAAIGTVFGLSAERTRQILAGIDVTPCPHCRPRPGT